MRMPHLLRGRLPRLLQVRWLGQLIDGIFQSALASFVLFSPERQSNAGAAALAFSVVLLPYSLVGPYAGILLDRFSRQRIVQFSNLLRACDLIVIAVLVKNSATGIGLTLFVLVAFGINRLILAGLSAGLPLLVSKTELISANALAVTGGTICVVLGGGIGIGLKNILDHGHKSDFSDSMLVVFAIIGYAVTALITSRLGRKEIGPLDHEIASQGWGELLEGFHLLRVHADAMRGIFATSIQRGGLTALTLMGLLLERNTYNSPTNPDAGLRGFAFALAIAGVGIGVGSIMSPIGVVKFGRHRWIRAMMVASAPFLFIFMVNPIEVTLIIAAFFVGLTGQAIKVTNDALVQSKIQDEFRGRVFAFYDVAVNGAIVAGAVVAAVVLPHTGKSVVLPLLIIAIYIISAGVILRAAKFSADLPATT
ncbi:MAG: MFS transporter [Actinomycetes bacterium]